MQPSKYCTIEVYLMLIIFIMCRDLIVPPDEFTYRNLWIIQVKIESGINT